MTNNMNPEALLVLFIGLIALGLFGFSLIFTFFRLVEVFLPLFFHGGLYVPSKNRSVKKMIALLEIKEGEKAVDLGSGDGRIVIALAQAGAQAYGYEINPFLVMKSRKKIKELGLEKSAFIFQKNFWKEDLSEFDAVTVYGLPNMMKGLENKLSKELRPNTKVALSAFGFPSWKCAKKEEEVSLYLK